MRAETFWRTSWRTTAALAGLAGLTVLLRHLVRLAGPGRPAEDADLRELRREVEPAGFVPTHEG